MTQQQFSEETGISQSTISDWKRKKTNPSADKIMRICATLNVSPYELLQDTSVSEQRDVPKDYVVISEGTDEHKLLVEFDNLPKASKDRLWGFIAALKD